jgi:hypothetical protein
MHEARCRGRLYSKAYARIKENPNGADFIAPNGSTDEEAGIILRPIRLAAIICSSNRHLHNN